MADKIIGELASLSAVSGDEYLYGDQASSDVKIIADELADYVFNTYNFNHSGNNANTIAGKIVALQAITDFSSLALKTYPIGSLYWSSKSTSPASLFGGTWTQVKDKFALAAGNTYAVGSTSGEATHLLTLAELPSHNHGGTGTPSNNTSGASSATNTGNNSVGHTHSIPALSGTAASNGAHTHTFAGLYSPNSGTSSSNKPGVASSGEDSTKWPSAGAHTHTVTTDAKTSGNNSASHTHTMAHTHSLQNHTHTTTAQGGGTPHNNMPPYVVKYCWERVE